MSVIPCPKDPSRDEILVELEAQRQRIATLEKDKRELERMLEIAVAQAQDYADALAQERDDLVTMLQVTTDHADAIEADLQKKAEELRERYQFIRHTFGRYISEDVVAQLLDSPEGMDLGGEKRRVTILMSDLRGFTAAAEHLEPQDVMTFLNRYLDAMVHIILSYRGTIIEILGDGLLVIFGAPIQQDDDAQRAVACALAMQSRMEEVNALLLREGLPEIEMGIGIHTGDVVVGNIGSQQRTKYGVVGNTVNLTGRIESQTTSSQVLISPTTYRETAALLKIKRQMTVELKGVPEPVTLYEVDGIGEDYAIRYDADTATVICKGSFRLRGGEEYAPILQLLMQAAAARHETLTLDLRTLEFLNSSGINTLSKFILEVRKHNASQVVIKGSSQFAWQARSLTNLQRLLPGLRMEIE
ncbi:MAG TPA: adenylate/guanylate cyclase domain-containing protein [Candidatus Entotheonella sp.]|jgi:class 3 adenylate cyclase